MSRSVCLVFLSFFTSLSAVAQSDTASVTPSWFMTIHSGALLGKKGFGTSASASILQGLRYKRFGLGAGMGYDAYREWRTLPLFAGVSYDLFQGRKNSFFLQWNYGYSKAWKLSTDEVAPDVGNAGGFFHHPFFGYRVQHGKLSVFFAAGYKFQRLTYVLPPPSWISAYPSHRTTVERDIRRMSIEMGIGFR